jgi:hypothetical protein
MSRLEGSPSVSINTSYVERANLSIRHIDAHFVRKALTFDKSFKLLEANFAICAAPYNLIRVHSSLGRSVDELSGQKVQAKMTPTMGAGATDNVWSYFELLEKVSYVN